MAKPSLTASLTNLFNSSNKVATEVAPKLTQTRYPAKKPVKTQPVRAGSKVTEPGQELLDALQSGRDYLSIFRASIKQHDLKLDDISVVLKTLLRKAWRHRLMLPRVLELCQDCGSVGRRAFNEFLTQQDEEHTIGLSHLRVILNSDLKLDSELVELFQLRLENRVVEILELQSLLAG